MSSALVTGINLEPLEKGLIDTPIATDLCYVSNATRLSEFFYSGTKSNAKNDLPHPNIQTRVVEVLVSADQSIYELHTQLVKALFYGSHNNLAAQEAKRVWLASRKNAPTTTAPWLQEALNTVKKLTKLPIGWSDADAKPSDEKSGSRMSDLLRNVSMFMNKPFLYPSPEGGVVAEFGLSKSQLIVIINQAECRLNKISEKSVEMRVFNYPVDHDEIIRCLRELSLD